MAILKTTLFAVLLVTVVMSKPVCLSEGEDSSSLESIESNSPEENETPAEPPQEPLQPAFTETDTPNAKEETTPTDTVSPADTEPSPATLDTTALPDPDPQTSTDTLQPMPEDPSHTALGVAIAQDVPPSDPAINADTVQVVVVDVGSTNQPQVTPTTYQGLPQGATTSSPPPIKPTPPPFSPAPPMPIPIENAQVMTGVPVCFTFQFATPEADPPRGDSI